jgi:DNA-binding NtrC family response regulator
MSVHAGGSILLVDDECEVLESFELILNSGGFRHTIACRDSREVLPTVKSTPVDVVLLDLSMPYLSGQELLSAFAQKYPEIPVIIVTATDDLETAVECMKYGAFDYIVKPVEKMRLISGVRRAMERQGLARENRALKHRLLSSRIEHSEAFERIITRNSSMISLFQYIEAIAPSPEPVLITGETGVGKELVAKAIHRINGSEGAFVAVNVAGLDDTAFSDTLFGHKKNAFTGAASSREGLVREATGGTLFLDEVGELQNGSQVKLLRLLQEHEFYPLGSDVPCLSSARIMAATNREVEVPSSQGGMRRDLFYRLQTHMIRIPPLRERMDDIPLLLDHFLEKAAVKLGKTAPGYPHELLTLLQTYHFPGNVRELETMVFDAVSRHKSHILSLETFTSRILGGMDAEKRMVMADADRNNTVFSSLKVLPTIKEASRQLIAEALKRSNGNQSIAARLLGITQPALSRRLSRPGRE